MNVGLWDLEAGRSARDEAMEAVDNPPWRVFAERALLAVMRRQADVTSDDVWAELDGMGIPRPTEPRAMGPVMMAAVRDGSLIPTGVRTGRNPKAHARPIRVYRSMFTYRPESA